MYTPTSGLAINTVSTAEAMITATNLECQRRVSDANCKSQLQNASLNCQELPGRMLCSYNSHRCLNETLHKSKPYFSHGKWPGSFRSFFFTWKHMGKCHIHFNPLKICLRRGYNSPNEAMFEYRPTARYLDPQN